MEDPRQNSSENAAPVVARAKRTYGRKQDASSILDQEPILPATSSTTEDVSGRSESPANEDAAEPPGGRASADNFGWKAKMDEIDKRYAGDDDDVQPDHKIVKEPKESGSASDAPAHEDDSFTTANSSIFDNAHLRSSTPITPDSSPMPQNRKRKQVAMASLTSDEGDGSPGSSKAKTSASRLRGKGTRSKASEDETELLPVLKLTRPSESPVAEKSDSQEPGSSKRKTESKAKSKARKIKKPSKAEEAESKKAHARMMAEQKASIRKTTKLFTMVDFLETVAQTEAHPGLKPQTPPRQPSSDPITDFSSPAPSPPRASASGRAPQPTLKSHPSFPKALEDSDEELVDVAELLAQKKDLETKEQRRQRLAEAKRKLIDAQAAKYAAGNLSDADDDGLDIVVSEPASSSKLKQRKGKLAAFGKTRKAQAIELGETQVLQAAAQPHFGRRRAKNDTDISHNEFLTILGNKSARQSDDITKAKEEEWVGKGGKLRNSGVAPATGNPLAIVLERLRSNTCGPEGMEGGVDAKAESSDEEWRPKGSESETSLSGEELGGEDAQKMNDADDADFNPDNTLVDDEDENELPKHKPARGFAHRFLGRAVLSDDEDEHPLRPTKVLVPDTSVVLDSPNMLEARVRKTSLSSLDEASLDENENKENDMSLMFDQGEDKENLAVPRPHSPGTTWSMNSSQNRKIFDLANGMQQRLSMSPRGPSTSQNQKKPTRNPLQQRDLDDMDAEFPPLSATVIGSDSPTRLQVSSASSSPKPLQPAFGERLGGLTQLFNDGDGRDENMPPPKRKPAFSFSGSLSGDSQPRPLQFGGPLSLSTTQEGFGGFRPLRGNVNELSLTLDTKLQPALEVNSQIRRKADDIFEKDQNFVWEEAARKPHTKAELYVTENGLLTQTRPDVSTPVIYRAVSPSQRSIVVDGSVGRLPSSTQRLPLRTLSFSGDLLSPEQPKLSRLRKGPRPNSDDENDPLPQKALFSKADAQLKADRREKRKAEEKKLEKSVFVEGEAQESDEDEVFGFGRREDSKSDEENSADEDLDATLHELVDDSKKEDERSDLVLEKVQEHQKLDDEALEKLHMDAVEGRMRGKRRGGRVGFDGSDSEEEDEEARRIRQKSKKRRVAGDTLEALGKDEKAEAFVRGYEEDLNDDAVNDFAHLAQDEMDVDENDENEEPRETVDASELQEQLRLAARIGKGKERERFDPENVDWAEAWNTSDDEKFGVKDVEIRRKATTAPRRNGFGQDGDMTRLLNKSEWNHEHLEAWRKEQGNRNFGSGRGAGAVTGHAKKTGATGTSKASRSAPTTQNEGAAKPALSKFDSILAAVPRKQGAFATQSK